MNQEVKKKWVTALRSGEYTQGRYMLQNKEGQLCCLGVLCDLYRKETGIGEWLEGGDSINGYTIAETVFADDNEVEGLSLTLDVAKWAGLNDTDPLIVKNGHPIKELSQLNDGWDDSGKTRKTFSEIADLIEENL